MHVARGIAKRKGKNGAAFARVQFKQRAPPAVANGGGGENADEDD